MAVSEGPVLKNTEKNLRRAFDFLGGVGGEDLIDEVVRLFLDQGPKRLAEARAALESASYPEMARKLHALRSSLGQLGGDELLAELQELEARAAGPDPDGRLLAEGLARFTGRLSEFSAGLSQELRKRDRGQAKARVAIIEDNSDSRLILGRILEPRYAAVKFRSGTEALNGLKGARPDAVLLDISLPDMDGVEILKKLREDPETRNLPVVAITAYAMSGDRERFLSSGFDAYVSKPITDPAALLDLLGRLLVPGAADRNSTERTEE